MKLLLISIFIYYSMSNLYSQQNGNTGNENNQNPVGKGFTFPSQIPSTLPPPPPPQEEGPRIYKMVEQMPRFPGCEEMSGSANEKYMCANDKLLKYIYKNLEYPVQAREKKIEGEVLLQFVISEEGTIEDIKVKRDIGNGCGEEAVRIIESMKTLPERWVAGKQNNIAVKVYYTLFVKFKLQNKSKNKRKKRNKRRRNK